MEQEASNLKKIIWKFYKGEPLTAGEEREASGNIALFNYMEDLKSARQFYEDQRKEREETYTKYLTSDFLYSLGLHLFKLIEENAKLKALFFEVEKLEQIKTIEPKLYGDKVTELLTVGARVFKKVDTALDNTSVLLLDPKTCTEDEGENDFYLSVLETQKEEEEKEQGENLVNLCRLLDLAEEKTTLEKACRWIASLEEEEDQETEENENKK